MAIHYPVHFCLLSNYLFPTAIASDTFHMVLTFSYDTLCAQTIQSHIWALNILWCSRVFLPPMVFLSRHWHPLAGPSVTLSMCAVAEMAVFCHICVCNVHVCIYMCMCIYVQCIWCAFSQKHLNTVCTIHHSV